jgi:ribosomal protein L4
LLYNKKNSILIIENLENELTRTKNKIILTNLSKLWISLDQKLLVVVSKKTTPLKLATQNLKTVELISASHLNTLSLLKAKQIILTPAAINDIKEIYCE